MSEEIVDSQVTDNGAVSPPEPAAAEPVVQHKSYQPFVDLTGLPDETKEAIEGRFNHFSRLMKKQDGKLSQWQTLAKEQSARIEELTGGFVGMANHLQEKTYNDTEAQLTEAMQKAWDTADHKAYVEAQTRLVELRAEKKSEEKQRKAAPVEKPQVQQQTFDSGIAPEDQRVIDSWQEEKDDSGNLLRPWAYNRSGDPQRPDRQFARGLFEMNDVLGDDRFQTMAEKVAEVDRRMGVKQASSRQNVMGGNLTGKPKSGKLTLTPVQEEFARKSRFAGPGKTDTEHYQAYKAQLELSKSKGTRA